MEGGFLYYRDFCKLVQAEKYFYLTQNMLKICFVPNSGEITFQKVAGVSGLEKEREAIN